MITIRWSYLRFSFSGIRRLSVIESAVHVDNVRGTAMFEKT